MKKLMKKAVALLCAVAMAVTSLHAWSQMQAVEAAETEQTDTTTVTPVELEGFRTITTKNFVDASGNPMEDSVEGTGYLKSKSYTLVDDKKEEIDSFDHTLLTMSMRFYHDDGTVLSTNAIFAFAGENTDVNDDTSSVNLDTGFKFFQSGDQAFTFNNVASDGTIDVVNKSAYNKMSIDTSVQAQEVLVQISIEYGNFYDDEHENDNKVNDIKVGFYFNGKHHSDKMLYGCNMANLGNKLELWTGGSKYHVIVSNPIQEEEAAANNFVTLPGFRTVGPTNLVSVKDGHNMGNSETFKANSDQFQLVDDEGNVLPNYDKTLLSMKVTFNSSGSLSNEYEIRFGGTTTQNGVRIFAGETSFTLNRRGSETITADRAYTSMKSLSAYGIEEKVTGKEVNLQISTEYLYSDTTSEMTGIKFVIYINGVKAAEKEISSEYIVQSKLGNSFCVMATSEKTMKISSIVDQKFVRLPGFTTVSTSDFGMANSAQYGESVDGTKNHWYTCKKADNLDQKLLTFKVKFPGTGTDYQIHFGGLTDDPSSTPFYIYPSSTTQLRLTRNNKSLITTDIQTTFSIENCGISDLTKEEFILQIAFEHTDSNQDGTDEAVKLTFYVNGTFALGKEITAISDITQIGKYINICCYDDSNPITVSAVPYMYGDTNPNGVTDIRDLVATVKASEGIAPSYNADGLGADVNKSGAIDLDDILVLCKKLLQR